MPIFQTFSPVYKSMEIAFENVNPNDNVHCCVIGCHGNALLHFCLNTKVSCEGFLGGGGKLF